MTAQEAKALSESKKKSFDDIMYSIRVMAESGSTCAAFDLEMVKDIEGYRESLEELGYEVTIFTNTFRVSW